MADHHPDADPHDEHRGEDERLLAGTLALMTAFYRMPRPEVCDRLIANLSQLAADPALSPPLRAVCDNVRARWTQYREHAIAARGGDAGGGADEGGAGRCARVLH